MSDHGPATLLPADRPEQTRHHAELCSLCLNLCMDVCPVAVHSGRSDLMPNVKMRSAAAVLEIRPGEPALPLLDACTDCGACTAHCVLGVDVSAWLEKARDELRQQEGVPAAVARVAPQPLVAIAPSDVPSDALALALCTECPDPAERLPGIRRLDVPLGSACCGARLPALEGAGEDLADLHRAMGRGMLSEAPDGATVVVTDAGCAAHLAAAVEGRVRVILLGDG